jgi:protein-L-isoaspartate O-methyltransferase
MLRWVRLRRVAALVAILAAFECILSLVPQVSAQVEPSTETPQRVVPFVPTPMKVVERMLELAKVSRNDVVYDLGSGDGRIVIMAAQEFGAHAVGVELDPKLFRESSARIQKLGLGKRAKIIYGNMFEVNVHPATVVTLYLLPSVNDEIEPMLDKELRSGTRVVSHDFSMNAWNVAKTERVTDENGGHHTIYLYIRP